MTQYIFRIDDVCTEMDYDKFKLLKNLFLKYKAPAVLCVIPKNKDPTINFEGIPKKDLIKELNSLEKKGWEIALHGYTHEINGGGGILKINKVGEFTGISYDEQNKKLREAKSILKKWGFNIKTLTLPWHSYDKNTIKASISNNIFIINEGLTLFPHKERGVLFIPNIMSIPREIPFGVVTCNIHPQDVNQIYLDKIEKFLKKYKPTTFNKIIYKKRLIKDIINKPSKIILKCLTS